MSAPLAGKFQDHYVVLGIDPYSDAAIIQRAHAQLAEKYDPDNNFDTGDEEKFAAVNLAFEVLSDPELRKAFDKLKGLDQDHGGPKFSGRPFFESTGREKLLRITLLSILYDRRRTHPFRPSLSNRNVESMLEVSNDEMTFSLWYLKQRGWVTADDKSSLQITMEGMEYLENHWPCPEDVIPLLKPSAVAEDDAACVNRPAA